VDALRVLAGVRDRLPGAKQKVLDTFEIARVEAGGDPRMLAEVALGVGLCELRNVGAAAAAEQAGIAVEMADAADAPTLLGQAHLLEESARFFLGLGLDPGRMEAALASIHKTDDSPLAPRVNQMYGTVLAFTDDLDAARAMLEPERKDALARGGLFGMANVLALLALVELRAGRYPRAEQYAAEAVDVAELIESDFDRGIAYGAQARLRAHQGRHDEARTDAEHGLDLAIASTNPRAFASCASALGFVALSSDDDEAAHAHLGPIADFVRAAGALDPGFMWFIPDDVEALTALGRLEEATVLLDLYEERARSLGRLSAIAASERSRALIRAMEGRVDEAVGLAQTALETLGRVDVPFDRGRTLLTLGQLRRRSGDRRGAQAALAEAAGTFAELGASMWQERAAGELARVGMR
jgi:tetratricopeptide (TPR) repeat protein